MDCEPRRPIGEDIGDVEEGGEPGSVGGGELGGEMSALSVTSKTAEALALFAVGLMRTVAKFRVS